ncbi:MAG: hypothetical protein FWG13_02915 [Leptospirales bacterium]|nr:hypothetical protein [Leptospirales bacterium]
MKHKIENHKHKLLAAGLLVASLFLFGCGSDGSSGNGGNAGAMYMGKASETKAMGAVDKFKFKLSKWLRFLPGTKAAHAAAENFSMQCTVMFGKNSATGHIWELYWPLDKTMEQVEQEFEGFKKEDCEENHDSHNDESCRHYAVEKEYVRLIKKAEQDGKITNVNLDADEVKTAVTLSNLVPVGENYKCDYVYLGMQLFCEGYNNTDGGDFSDAFRRENYVGDFDLVFIDKSLLGSDEIEFYADYDMDGAGEEHESGGWQKRSVLRGKLGKDSQGNDVYDNIIDVNNKGSFALIPFDAIDLTQGRFNLKMEWKKDKLLDALQSVGGDYYKALERESGVNKDSGIGKLLNAHKLEVLPL